MDEERKQRYEVMLSETREIIQSIEQTMEELVAEVKRRVAQLKGEKDIQLNIYDNYCKLLGLENDLESDEDDEDEE
ncbi:hypothetical protein SCOR_07070 [Sulfidibacter corallicola]|uniref:Uncharacterized protein n=1 Tax=Sulfidibacter corallicola TaxID=2818388 RepID=A0A8A4TPK0_SULCO|nr:hypothetical protein [Sulfidibacter corallicola]QTD51473.1 hypothetical protein J3U87_03300 [Sulfidibacter corallicola]